VRVRDHLLLSTGGAALLYPYLGRRVLVPWSASVFIDVDHYVWFCVHERSVNALRAVRFFNQAQPPQHAGTRLLHHPAVLLLLLVLSARWRWAGLLVTGMAFHVGLDVYHAARLDAARSGALRRDDSTCQRCGAQGPDVVAHQWHQPRLLPSYRPEHLTSLCGACHEAAHGHRHGHG
jgi:5-methylcytosine-specific restriction endonuclease McrA